MTISDIANNFLKIYYDQKGGLLKQVYEDYPLLDKIPKDPNGGGLTYQTSVYLDNPVGVGTSLSIAQSLAGQTNGNIKGAMWTVPWGELDASVTLSDKLISQSRNNSVAFLNYLEEQVEGLHRRFLENLSQSLYFDAGRSIGYGTIASGGVITLASYTDAIKFHVGDQIVASANDGTSSSHALLGSGSIGYVIAIDQQSGTITVSATSGGSGGIPSSWTGSMYFFRNGEFGGGSSPAITFAGLGAWLPASAPTSGDSFMGIDRTQDVAKLSGYRLSATDVAGRSTMSRIKLLVTNIQALGTTPGITDVIVNPLKWQEIVDEMQAQGVRPLQGDTTDKGSWGYNSIRLAIGGKWVEIQADRHCPINTGYALTMPKDGSNIKIVSLEELVHAIMGDNLKLLRSATANTYEHRTVSYPAFVMKAPGWCGRTPL